jgi:hypothetical protein
MGIAFLVSDVWRFNYVLHYGTQSLLNMSEGYGWSRSYVTLAKLSHLSTRCYTQHTYFMYGGDSSSNLNPETVHSPGKCCTASNYKPHVVYSHYKYLRLVSMKNVVFRVVVPRRSCVKRRFGGTLQPSTHASSSLADFSTLKTEGIRSSETLQSSTHASSSLADFLPSIWRWYFPPKRRFTQDLHDSKSQKTAFFIDTAVKTSNIITCQRILQVGSEFILFKKC